MARVTLSRSRTSGSARARSAWLTLPVRAHARRAHDPPTHRSLPSVRVPGYSPRAPGELCVCAQRRVHDKMGVKYLCITNRRVLLLCCYGRHIVCPVPIEPKMSSGGRCAAEISNE